MVDKTIEKRLITKVQQLSLQQLQQVEQFIDLLNSKKTDQSLTLAFTQLSESSFNQVWDNLADAVYDDL